MGDYGGVDPATVGTFSASSADTLTNKTIDADGTGNNITNIDIGNCIAASQAEAEAGTDNTKLLTSLRTAQAIAALAVGSVTASSTDTFTNKTIDADGTGNALSNIDVANCIAASSAEGIAGTDNTKILTSLIVATAINQGGFLKAGTVAGVDTITAVLTPAIASYGVGLKFWFIAAGANTGAVTVNLNSVGALALKKSGGSALVAGDIAGAGAIVECAYDGTDLEFTNAPSTSNSTDVTTKGDLQGFSTVGARIPVGNDGEIVLANSSSALGVVYVPYSGKNFIHNGAFRVATRGTSFTAATSPLNSDGVALLDRWGLLSDGNDIVDVTRGTDGAVGNGTYCQADVETVSKKFGFLQIMENAEVQELLSLSDVVSLSFNALVSDATKLSRIKAMIVSWAGTVDAPTADIVSAWGVEGTSPTMVANWTIEGDSGDLGVTASDVRYKLENVAIDTASVKNLGVFIWSDDVATNDTLGTLLKITNVKLEKGPIATPFQDVDIEVEKSRCRRFAYWFTQCIGYVDGSTATAFKLYGKFPTPMRKSPTMTAMAAVATAQLHANIAGPTTIATSLTGDVDGLDAGAFVTFGAGATVGIVYKVSGTFKAEADFF